jgi:predicted transcriptional regulator
MTKQAEAVRSELEAFLNSVEIRDPIRPDEISVDGFAQLRGLSRSASERVLKGLVREGKMTRRMASVDGKYCYAYAVSKK